MPRYDRFKRGSTRSVGTSATPSASCAAAPSFMAAAVLALALGIGATTAIFTVVNAVLLRPLPYPQPDRLVYIKEKLSSGLNPVSRSKEFIAWKNRSQTLNPIAGYTASDANLTGGNAPPERVHCGLATASFFTLLGVQPAAGRIILPDDDRLGASPIALLSQSFWQRRFAGAASAIGSTVTLDARSYTVAGILPASPRVPDQWAQRGATKRMVRLAARKSLVVT